MQGLATVLVDGKTPEQLIDEIAPIVVQGDTAICDGGG
jgi:hypothetical protein